MLAPGFYDRGPVVVRGRPRLWESESWADTVLTKVRLDTMAESNSA